MQQQIARYHTAISQMERAVGLWHPEWHVSVIECINLLNKTNTYLKVNIEEWKTFHFVSTFIHVFNGVQWGVILGN